MVELTVPWPTQLNGVRRLLTGLYEYRSLGSMNADHASAPRGHWELIVSRWDPSEGALSLLEHAGPDTLIPLDVAIWASEIADPMNFPTFSTAQLRAATVAAPPHRLKSMRPGHAILTTRRLLQEWRDSWLDPSNPPASSSIGSDRSGPSPTSSTASAISAEHDTALMLAQRLKKSSPSTSRSRRG